MTGSPFQVNSREDIPRLISICETGGMPYRVPIYEALYRGIIAHDEYMRDTPVGRVKDFLSVVRKPALILCGDDDNQSTGPDGWPHTRRLMQWCKRILIHAAGGRRQEYENAVIETFVVGRFLLIETSSAQSQAWIAAMERWAPHASQHVITPPPGYQWPNPQNKEGMN